MCYILWEGKEPFKKKCLRANDKIASDSRKYVCVLLKANDKSMLDFKG